MIDINAARMMADKPAARKYFDSIACHSWPFSINRCGISYGLSQKAESEFPSARILETLVGMVGGRHDGIGAGITCALGQTAVPIQVNLRTPHESFLVDAPPSLRFVRATASLFSRPFSGAPPGTARRHLQISSDTCPNFPCFFFRKHGLIQPKRPKSELLSLGD